MINRDDFFTTGEPFWKKGGDLWDPLRTLLGFLRNSPFKIETEIPESVFIKGKVSIGKGTVIDPGVFIEGPCHIGKNCKVGHGAYLRPGTVLLDHSTVGHAAEIKHSLLMEGATASHLCYVGDSILGPNVNLGAGVKCANLRLDRKPIFFIINGKKVDTQLEKFGAILGEGVQVGCNAVLNPGTLIGKNSIVYPLVNIGGYISPKRSVK